MSKSKEVIKDNKAIEEQRRIQAIRLRKRRRRAKIEEIEPKFVRLNIDPMMQDYLLKETHPHVAIDDIYAESRHAVQKELDEVDDLFLVKAAEEDKTADDLELTNLLFEKERALKEVQVKREVKEFLEATKKEFYDKARKDEKELKNKAQRKVQEMLDSQEEIDETKKSFLKKSMYELAAEMQNETMAPSIDSYGDPNVFLKYKKHQWFESVNIIKLKRQ